MNRKLFIGTLFLSVFLFFASASVSAQICNIGSDVISCSGFIVGQEESGTLGTFTGSEEWSALGKAPFPGPTGDIPYGMRLQRNLTQALFQIQQRTGLTTQKTFDVNIWWGTTKTTNSPPPLARLDFDYIFQDQTVFPPTASNLNYMSLVGAFSKQFTPGGPIAICGSLGGPCFGRVGIENTNPSFTLDVNGITRCTGLIITSDRAFKTDINTIDNSMETIRQLRGTSYGYVDSEDLENFDFGPGKTYGMIAQEVEEVLPELVYTDDEGYKGVNYIGIIPHLVEAVKVLDEENQELKKRLAALENGSNSSKGNSGTGLLEETRGAELFQNVPNPFNQRTEIQVFLPTSVKDAQLLIFDMNGKMINKVAVDQRGESNIAIEGSTLQAGMYFYSLIADGQEIDTKRMILTK